MTPGAADARAEWRPSHSPWLVAFSVLLATFMQVLDTSVANVALPHIAGSLSSTPSEATWVLTSYLVSSAIVLAAASWLSTYFGRKRYMAFSVLLFTLSSAACGLAQSLPQLILARILQGIGGGGLLPLSQAVLLESFPREKRGVAMSAYGMGIVVAPIIGPILGGWITDNFSWRWIFYINVPIGFAGFFLQQFFLEDPPYLKNTRGQKIDYAGLLLMALSLGLFQIIVDKGQEADWFGAAWVRRSSLLVALAFPAFILWELRIKKPFMDLRLLGDRNLAAGSALIALMGAILYGATALLPVFMQTLLGYSALASGWAMMPRGIGTFLSVMAVGRLMRRVEERLLMLAGFLLLGVTCWRLGGLDLQVAESNIALTLFFNGIGMGLIFVPLTTLSMSTLQQDELNQGSGIFNLMRNIGASVSIALIFTAQVRLAQVHQAALAAHVSPYDFQFQSWLFSERSLLSSLPAAQAEQDLYGLAYRDLLQQASLLSFMDCFRLLAVLSFCCCLLLFLFRKTGKEPGAPRESAGPGE